MKMPSNKALQPTAATQVCRAIMEDLNIIVAHSGSLRRLWLSFGR